MSPDLKELLALLNLRDVRYLVTGGYAVAAHGSPRYTKDLDLWIDREVEPDRAMIEQVLNKTDKSAC